MSKYSNHWFNLAAIALAAIVAGCGGGEQAAADAAADASIRRALATGGSSTGVDTIYSEAGKLVRAEETVDSLGNELFGEKVSLYNGALEFVQSDVSIQGNSSIPVSVARRLT